MEAKCAVLSPVLSTECWVVRSCMQVQEPLCWLPLSKCTRCNGPMHQGNAAKFVCCGLGKTIASWWYTYSYV